CRPSAAAPPEAHPGSRSCSTRSSTDRSSGLHTAPTKRRPSPPQRDAISWWPSQLVSLSVVDLSTRTEPFGEKALPPINPGSRATGPAPPRGPAHRCMGNRSVKSASVGEGLDKVEVVEEIHLTVEVDVRVHAAA